MEGYKDKNGFNMYHNIQKAVETGALSQGEGALMLCCVCEDINPEQALQLFSMKDGIMDDGLSCENGDEDEFE